MEELEKAVEAKLREGVKALGGVSYKWVSPGQSGVPDRIVLWPGRIDLVELKTAMGRLSPIQKRQIGRIEEVLGRNVLVLYGSADVEAYLRARSKTL
ncbi:VRR-NUC domain-containing protein [Acidaminococcus intestini]|uniref:VRR-NUC domain-containing protein n=1 Tax=Acidaminococcus intestini TaxID=187327 RepID=UPI003AB776D3